MHAPPRPALAALAAFAALVGLVGCGDDDEEEEAASDLKGEWELVYQSIGDGSGGYPTTDDLENEDGNRVGTVTRGFRLQMNDPESGVYYVYAQKDYSSGQSDIDKATVAAVRSVDAGDDLFTVTWTSQSPSTFPTVTTACALRDSELNCAGTADTAGDDTGGGGTSVQLRFVDR